MTEASEFYKTYQADNDLSPLSHEVVNKILQTSPSSVLEFGCGSCKNLKLIRDKQSSIKVYGIDISLMNVIVGSVKNDIDYIAFGDQDWLPRINSMDVVFTVSVLDHIEEVGDIIKEFKRMAKHVFLAEPLLDKPEAFYWAHDYEKLGFKKIDYEWKSNEDGNTYYIWHWQNIPCVG